MSDVKVARVVGSTETAAAQARENAVSTEMLRLVMEEHENAVERIEELEGDRGQLEADSDLARWQYQAVPQVLEDLEAVHSCTRRDLASSERVVARLEEEIVAARSGAGTAEQRAEDLEKNLEKVRNSCFEFQARAVAAEGGQAATADEARRALEAAAGREEALLAVVKVGESEVMESLWSGQGLIRERWCCARGWWMMAVIIGNSWNLDLLLFLRTPHHGHTLVTDNHINTHIKLNW